VSDLKSFLIVIVAACLIPLAIYFIKPRTKGRRLFGIVSLVTLLVFSLYVLLLDIYRDISPPLYFFFWFTIISLSIYLVGRRRA
jgi:hypothetical protein